MTPIIARSCAKRAAPTGMLRAAVLVCTLFLAMALVLAPIDVLAAPADSEPIVLPDGTSIEDVDFERHVASLFGRLGCNSAACHGSFQGKGGFRLSLFGQSPLADYAAIASDPNHLRIERDAPEDSLLLVKPTGTEQHGGGVRIRPGSWEHRLIRRWITAGARHNPDHGVVRQLLIEPAEVAQLNVGQTVRLKVRARFATGDEQDVTAFSEFRGRDDAVAEIDGGGQVTGRGSGDTSLTVSYRGSFVGVSVTVPFRRDAGQVEATQPANFIDQEIDRRLVDLGLTISPPADDAEFLRRARLDVTGTLPEPDEVKYFIGDKDPARRDKLIDALLADPRRAALWATKMCDITNCNVDTMESPAELRPKKARMWHDWFRKRFEDNILYDEIVQGVLCATSRNGQPIDDWIDDEAAREHSARETFESKYRERAVLDLFWRRIGPQGPVPVEDLAELAASAFLGVRMHCARCHQHPFDRWTQHDFAGFAQIFARVEFGSSTLLRTTMNARLDRQRQSRQAGQAAPALPRLQEVFLADTPHPLDDAAGAGPAFPKAPGGPTLNASSDPREELFRWLVQPDNPLFARSFVNRIWAKYFGAGLVEPVDALSPANPPTHPRLLDRLAAEFVRSGYDIRHMERLILTSQAYQRSSRPTGNNSSDRHNVARAPIRPLMAEVLVDAINASLESAEDFGTDAPVGTRAIELAPNRLSNPSANEMFRILGRGDRKSLCDCDRAVSPSVRQPLFVMSDARVVGKIRNGRLARLLTANRTDAEILDEFFLATLSRFPNDEEREFLLQHTAGHGDRAAALADVVWALINTREFATNH